MHIMWAECQEYYWDMHHLPGIPTLSIWTFQVIQAICKYSNEVWHERNQINNSPTNLHPGTNPNSINKAIIQKFEEGNKTVLPIDSNFFKRPIQTILDMTKKLKKTWLVSVQIAQQHYTDTHNPYDPAQPAITKYFPIL